MAHVNTKWNGHSIAKMLSISELERQLAAFPDLITSGPSRSVESVSMQSTRMVELPMSLSRSCTAHVTAVLASSRQPRDGSTESCVDASTAANILTVRLPRSAEAATVFFKGALLSRGKNSETFQVDRFCHATRGSSTSVVHKMPALATADEACTAWVQGFDVTLLASGQRGTGKSALIFGSPALQSPSIVRLLLDCAVSRLVTVARTARMVAGTAHHPEVRAHGSQLRANAQAAVQGRVIVQCWGINCLDEETDLLSNIPPCGALAATASSKSRKRVATASPNMPPHKRVVVADVEEALEIIRSALLRSGNYCPAGARPGSKSGDESLVPGSWPLLPVSGVQHVFLRLELEQPCGPGTLLQSQYNCSSDFSPAICCSSVVLVDVVGWPTISGPTTVTGRLRADEVPVENVIPVPDAFVRQHLSVDRLVDSLCSSQRVAQARDMTTQSGDHGTLHDGHASFRVDQHNNDALGSGLLVTAKGVDVSVRVIPPPAESSLGHGFVHYRDTTLSRHLGPLLSSSRILYHFAFVSTALEDSMDGARTLRMASLLRQLVSRVVRADVVPQRTRDGPILSYEKWASEAAVADARAMNASGGIAESRANSSGRQTDSSVRQRHEDKSVDRLPQRTGHTIHRSPTTSVSTPTRQSAPVTPTVAVELQSASVAFTPTSVPAPYFGEVYASDLRNIEGAMAQLITGIAGRIPAIGNSRTYGELQSVAIAPMAQTGSRSDFVAAMGSKMVPGLPPFVSPAQTLQLTLSPGSPELSSPQGVRLAASQASVQGLGLAVSRVSAISLEGEAHKETGGSGRNARSAPTTPSRRAQSRGQVLTAGSSSRSSPSTSNGRPVRPASRASSNGRQSALDMASRMSSIDIATAIMESSSSSGESVLSHEEGQQPRSASIGSRPAGSLQAELLPARKASLMPSRRGSRGGPVPAEHDSPLPGTMDGSESPADAFLAVFQPSMGPSTVHAYRQTAESSSDEDSPAPIPPPPVRVRTKKRQTESTDAIAQEVEDSADGLDDDPVLKELAAAVRELADARRAGVSREGTSGPAHDVISVARELAQTAKQSLNESTVSTDISLRPSADELPLPGTVESGATFHTLGMSDSDSVPAMRMSPEARPAASTTGVGPEEVCVEVLVPFPRGKSSPSRGSSPVPLASVDRNRDGFTGFTTPQGLVDGERKVDQPRSAFYDARLGSAVSRRTAMSSSLHSAAPLPPSAPSSPVTLAQNRARYRRRSLTDDGTQTAPADGSSPDRRIEGSGASLSAHELSRLLDLLPPEAAALLGPYSLGLTAKGHEADQARASSAALEERVVTMSQRLAALVQHLQSVVNAAEAAAAVVDSVEAEASGEGEDHVGNTSHFENAEPSNSTPSRGSRAKAVLPGDVDSPFLPASFAPFPRLGSAASGLVAAATHAETLPGPQGPISEFSPYKSANAQRAERSPVRYSPDSLRKTAFRAREYAASLREALGLSPSKADAPPAIEDNVMGSADRLAPPTALSTAAHAAHVPDSEHRPSRRQAVGGGLQSSTIAALAEEAADLLNGGLSALQAQVRHHREEANHLREGLADVESTRRLEGVYRRRLESLTHQVAEQNRMRRKAEAKSTELERELSMGQASLRASDAQVMSLLHAQASTMARLEEAKVEYAQGPKR